MSATGDSSGASAMASAGGSDLTDPGRAKEFNSRLGCRLDAGQAGAELPV